MDDSPLDRSFGLFDRDAEEDAVASLNCNSVKLRRGFVLGAVLLLISWFYWLWGQAAATTDTLTRVNGLATIVVAIATALYTALTLMLVLETRASRTARERPFVSTYFERNVRMIQFVFSNSGPVAARNVSFHFDVPL